MRKYFVAFLLDGDVRNYSLRLSEEISNRYHTVRFFDKVTPHITVKIPFLSDNDGIKDVERTLRAFARTQCAPRVTIKGFGHFGFRTIYLSTEGNEAADFVRACLSQLTRNIPWLPTPPLEGNKLHVSVARYLTRRKFLKIWRALKGVSPTFSNRLDNLAILVHEEGKWRVYALIPVRTEALGELTAADSGRMVSV